MKHAVGQQRIGISWLDSKDSVHLSSWCWASNSQLDCFVYAKSVKMTSSIPIKCDYTSKSLLRVCLVGVKTGKMENRKRKIWWKMTFSTIWLRGRGGEKSGGAHKFFSHPPTKYNLSKLERKLEWKVGKIFKQNCSHL